MLNRSKMIKEFDGFNVPRILRDMAKPSNYISLYSVKTMSGDDES